jgi:hypothetical protein
MKSTIFLSILFVFMPCNILTDDLLIPTSGEPSFNVGRITGKNKKSPVPPAKNYRYVVCTDMTHDDGNSLIRLLHYANEIDIEAIIITDQGPESLKTPGWPAIIWNKAQTIINSYSQVEDNLRLHDPDFPTAAYIRSITKQGKGFAQRMSGSMDKGNEHFWDYVGETRDSEGSEYLQKVFDKKDDRPIYVAFWGGSITFAQAMWRYQQHHTDKEVQALLDKLIFHCISFQDITFDYFVDLDSIGNKFFNKKFYGDYEGKRLTPSMMMGDILHFWRYIGPVDANIVHKNSGPLGALYDKGGEGDTPSFLNLISMNLGLNDIKYPSYGGWGDMFIKQSLPNFWFAENANLNELMRWLPQTNNSFYARCKWEQNKFSSANHAPVAAFNKNKSSKFIYLSAKPGEIVKLSAKGSSDPDGNNLSYKWWRYNEADSYNGEINITNSNAIDASFIFPADIKDKNIHIILEIQDDGDPALISYRRIIISKEI